MGAALETVTGYLTTAALTAGTYAAVTANSGQSYSIRATPTPLAGELLAPWADAKSAGYVQIKSPRMHDTTIGTTFANQGYAATLPVEPLGALDYSEPAYSTDVLTVQFTPQTTIAAGETEVVGFSVYYPNLPGIAANFMTWAQVQSYVNPAAKTGDHYVSWVRPSTAATAGQIGVGVAINSTNDQFKANHSYALLGYLVITQVGAVLIQGIDTGNLYVGGPGSLNPRTTRQFFVDLSIAQGFACIPVIQANNKGATFVYLVDAATTATAATVGLVWMDLGVLSGLGLS